MTQGSGWKEGEEALQPGEKQDALGRASARTCRRQPGKVFCKEEQALGQAHRGTDCRSKLIWLTLVCLGLCWGGDVWFPVFKQAV